jgi:ureidoglycolate hydrolase
MEVQAHLITRSPFTEFGVMIQHGQYTMKMTCDSSIIKLTQRELYSIAEIDLVDH